MCLCETKIIKIKTKIHLLQKINENNNYVTQNYKSKKILRYELIKICLQIM